MTADTPRYRSVYVYGEGYIVFKDEDGSICRSLDKVKANKVAVFVDELPAIDYCCYRNEFFRISGHDRLYGERPTSQTLNVKVDICSIAFQILSSSS